VKHGGNRGDVRVWREPAANGVWTVAVMFDQGLTTGETVSWLDEQRR